MHRSLIGVFALAAAWLLLQAPPSERVRLGASLGGALAAAREEKPSRTSVYSETFPRGQVCGEDDFLNVLVSKLIDLELARQPATRSAVGVFDAAFLPRGVGVTEPCRHVAHGA